MFLKDVDNTLFCCLTQNKKMLGYFLHLLYQNKSSTNDLQSIYNKAKSKYPTLTVPLEIIAKEIESTITAYCDYYIGKDNVDIDNTKYRSVPEVIQGEILPTTDDPIFRAFLVNLLNGKIIK